MEMSGQQDIAAPKEAVWAALNDPEVLKACITGCQSLEKSGDTHFAATVKAAVGPVKATFKGEVDLENMNPPHSYTLVGQGKGGAAGFAKGSADVSLEEAGGGTTLTYGVKANVGGQLARIGSRLIDGAAKKYADEFFTAFKTHVEASVQAAADGPETPTETPAAVMEEPAPEAVTEEPAAAPEPQQTQITPETEPEAAGGIPAFVWGGALAVAVVLAIIFLL
ncbi:MAG: SRPBCC domain-containing protein [Pseudomonadota bacterium]